MSFDHNFLSNPPPETQGKTEAWSRMRTCVCLHLLPGDGTVTSERSSFDPRNKEGWEGKGKRWQEGER